MYGSLELGWKLAGIQIAVQLSILILTRLLQRKDIGRRAVVEVKGNTGIGKAVENILAVCGYMVMFGAISAVIGSLAGERLGNLILLALDLPGGSAKLSGMMIKGRLMLQCAAIGVGGLCIACQNMDVLKKAGVTWKDYLLGRVTAMLMFVCLGGMVLGAGEPEAVMGYVNKRVNVFAAALFFASLSIFPWIYSLEKYTFLNKRKFENEMENDGMDRNI